MFDGTTVGTGDEQQAIRNKPLVAGRSLLITLLVALPAVAQDPCPPQIVTVDGETVVSAGVACPSNDTQRSRTPDYQDPVASCSALQSRRVVTVSSGSALQQALTNANCGDTIRLAAGRYSTNINLRKSCPAENPIIVEGAANFGSVVTGRWTTTGDRNIVTGIKFSGPSSGVTCRGNNNKILGNQFTGTASSAVQLSVESSEGYACEVAYNEMYRPQSGCHGSGEFKQAIKMNTAGTGESDSAQRNVWIHHNHFRDWDSDGCNQGDVIEIGESGNYDWAPNLRLGMYLENNLIERYNRKGQAAVDMKIGGNVVRGNTLRDSPDTRIQGRFGIGSVWESNFIDGGALLVNNRDNIVACNHVRGQNIRVQAGTQEPEALGNGYARAVNTLVARNNGALLVGHQYNGNHKLAARNTRIESHSGRVSFGLHAGTVDNRGDQSGYVCPTAVEMRDSQVGPAALDRAPATYLRCRRP